MTLEAAIGGIWDVEVETGDLEDGEEALTVLRLMNEVQEQFNSLAQPRHNALRNERLLAGQEHEGENVEALYDLDWFDGRRSERNIIAGLRNTYTSRLLEERQTVYAFPGDTSISDAAAAEIANSILDHLHEVGDHAELWADAVDNTQAHSAVALKPVWDPNGGDQYTLVDFAYLDDQTFEVVEDTEYFSSREAAEEFAAQVDGQLREARMGEVRVDQFTVFDYVTDGREDEDKSDWCAFRRVLSIHEARAEVMKAYDERAAELGIDDMEGLPEPEIAASEMKGAWGENYEGVEAWEVWHRPTDRVPEGLFAVVIDGQWVTQATSFPYEHGELPIAVLKLQKRRNHPFGITHIDFARPIQVEVDRKTRLLNRAHDLWARFLRLKISKSLLKQVEEEGDYLPVNGKDDVIEWVVPPFDALFAHANDIAREKQDMHEVFGLQLNANDSASSGREVAYRKDLETQKLAKAALLLNKCQRRVYRQSLRLYQQFVEAERKLWVAGEDGEPKLLAFNKASISGWDVKLEPAHGDVRLRAPKHAAQQEEAAAGVRAPHDVHESGLEEGGFEMADRQAVQMQIGEVLDGGFAQPDPNVDPVIAAEEVRLALETQALGDREAQMALSQLLLAYQLRAQQGQTPQAGVPQQGTGGASQAVAPTQTAGGLPAGMRAGPVPQQGG